MLITHLSKIANSRLINADQSSSCSLNSSRMIQFTLCKNLITFAFLHTMLNRLNVIPSKYSTINATISIGRVSKRFICLPNPVARKEGVDREISLRKRDDCKISRCPRHHSVFFVLRGKAISATLHKMEYTTQTCVALPPEILSYLFRFLDARDICIPVSSVCW